MNLEIYFSFVLFSILIQKVFPVDIFTFHKALNELKVHRNETCPRFFFGRTHKHRSNHNAPGDFQENWFSKNWLVLFCKKLAQPDVAHVSQPRPKFRLRPWERFSFSFSLSFSWLFFYLKMSFGMKTLTLEDTRKKAQVLPSFIFFLFNSSFHLFWLLEKVKGIHNSN